MPIERKKIKDFTDAQLRELLYQRIHVEGNNIIKIKNELETSEVNLIMWCTYLGIEVPILRKRFKEMDDETFRNFLNDEIWIKNKSAEILKREFNVSTAFIFRWCAKFGILMRTGSEANLVRFSGSTIEERLAITAKAHAAVRGMKRSQSDLEKRARGVEYAPMSKWELWFAKWLLEANITGFKHSYALGIFNLDFAFPENKVAIEIDGGAWHSSERKKLQDAKKEAYLTAQGWTLYRVSSHGYKNKTNEYSTSYKQKSSELINLLKVTLNSGLDRGPF